MQRPNTPGPRVLGSGAADKSDNGRDGGISTHTRYFASGTEKSAADWDNNVRSYLASALKQSRPMSGKGFDESRTRLNSIGGAVTRVTITQIEYGGK